MQAIPSTASRLGNNMRFKLLAEGVSRVFSMIFFVVLAQALGTEGYGRYAFPLAFTGLFLYFADCGLNTLLIRELARYREQAQQYIYHALFLKGALTLFTLALMQSAAWLSGLRAGEFEAIFWAGLITLAMGWLDLLSAIFNGLEWIEAETALRLQNRLLTLGSILLTLCWSRDVLLLLKILALANGLSLLLGAIQVKKLVATRQIWPQKSVWNWRFAGQLLQTGLPFWLSGLFALLYFRMDVAMLHLLGRSAAEVGEYQAVVKLLDLLVLLPNLLLMAIFPVLSQWGSEEQAQKQTRIQTQIQTQMQTLTRQSLELAWLVAWPLSLGGYLLAGPMIESLLGKAFGAAVPFWQILLLSLIFLFVNHICFYSLAALNLTRLLVLSSALGVGLNLGLNLLWIPLWGGLGAAWSTVLTEALVCLINFTVLYRSLDLKLSWGLGFKGGAATLGMGLGVQLLVAGGLPWWLILPLAILLYALLLLGFKTLTEDQRLALKRWGEDKFRAYTGKKHL
ncbi:MAG: flippase [Candidatus Sericytochromatia bacterium]